MDMKIIKLTNRGETMVDDADFEWLTAWKWRQDSKGYATRSEYFGKINGKYVSKTVLMHRVIVDTPNGMDTDHANGNTLDNQRSNLRACTRSQNRMNSLLAGKRYTGISEFRGRYMARIAVNKKPIFLGYFPSALEAAQAYNEAAIKYHGEYARLNEL